MTDSVLQESWRVYAEITGEGYLCESSSLIIAMRGNIILLTQGWIVILTRHYGLIAEKENGSRASWFEN